MRQRLQLLPELPSISIRRVEEPKASGPAANQQRVLAASFRLTLEPRLHFLLFQGSMILKPEYSLSLQDMNGMVICSRHGGDDRHGAEYLLVSRLAF
jgi:hypothetical protein